MQTTTSSVSVLLCCVFAVGCTATDMPSVETNMPISTPLGLEAIADMAVADRVSLCDTMAESHQLDETSRAELLDVCGQDGETFLAAYSDVMASIPSGQRDGISARPGCYCFRGLPPGVGTFQAVFWSPDFWTTAFVCAVAEASPEFYACGVLFP